MPFLRSLLPVTTAITLSACATTAVDVDPEKDHGIQWVKHAAEYQAISAQVYANATADLARFLDDKDWSAVPGRQTPELPPAVILDVDETVVSNVDFQLTFERPFTARKLDAWSSHYDSLPVRGVQDFVLAARDAGVTVFFVTNRPCEQTADDACPLERTTVDDIREVGIAVEPEFVLLAGEQSDWGREKITRREFVAQNYRVIMLIGDDFGDFVPCVRKKIIAPCTASATRRSRASDIEKYDSYWGNGWYILPNPMHGSWTSVR